MLRHGFILGMALGYSCLAGADTTVAALGAQQLPRADKVLVRKSERKLYLLKQGRVIKSYRVALGDNPNGHKARLGDSKTPEGEYVLDWRNPNSRYHLSIHISYPNEEDIRRAEALGVSPGGNIMIHGTPPAGNRGSSVGATRQDWTDGCIAVSNSDMEEIWRAVDDGTPIEIIL